MGGLLGGNDDVGGGAGGTGGVDGLGGTGGDGGLVGGGGGGLTDIKIPTIEIDVPQISIGGIDIPDIPDIKIGPGGGKIDQDYYMNALFLEKLMSLDEETRKKIGHGLEVENGFVDNCAYHGRSCKNQT